MMCQREEGKQTIKTWVVERASDQPVTSKDLVSHFGMPPMRASGLMCVLRREGRIKQQHVLPCGTITYVATDEGKAWLKLPRSALGFVLTKPPKERVTRGRSANDLARMNDLPDTPPEDGYGSGGKIALEECWAEVR